MAGWHGQDRYLQKYNRSRKRQGLPYSLRSMRYLAATELCHLLIQEDALRHPHPRLSGFRPSTGAGSRAAPRPPGKRDGARRDSDYSKKEEGRRPFGRRPSKNPAASYSPTGASCSTLGDGALHFRVRNGNGCCLPSMAAGKTRPRAPARENKQAHSLGMGAATSARGGESRPCGLQNEAL